MQSTPAHKTENISFPNEQIMRLRPYWGESRTELSSNSQTSAFIMS